MPEPGGGDRCFCVGKRPDLARHLPWAIAAVATRAFRVNGVVQLLPLVEKMNQARNRRPHRQVRGAPVEPHSMRAA